MKSVCEKYPEWLATQAEALSTADYERYGAQYQVRATSVGLG
jgi:peroxin-19